MEPRRVRRVGRVGTIAALAASCLVGIARANAATEATAKSSSRSSPCQLGNGAGDIKHVIYIQFDNVHLTRDNPNVPSDLEQMPNLLNFLKSNGTVLDKHYTILISHTAGGITASLTGLYPDRMGITESNSYDYYNTMTGIPTFTSAFKYWIAPVAAPVDTLPNMVNADSGSPKNAPAPWVSYTRAGCDVGNVSVANTVLENNNAVFVSGGPTPLARDASIGDTNIKVGSVSGLTAGKMITIDAGSNAEMATILHQGTGGANGTGLDLTAPLTKNHPLGATVYGPTTTDPTGDLTTLFGENSPEWNEGKMSQTSPPGTAARLLAQTDFVGIAVHCGKTPTIAGSVCRNGQNARTDPLPDEPGGYNGFQALFGAKYVNPAITGGLNVVNDLNGNPITDGFGQPGFPGFDSMLAATTLGYIAQMQEAGIPVTYAYISDLHDNHQGGGAYGPGEADYVAALKTYDDAFGKFFNRLAADGINKSNTLFVVTADENDHFAGQQAQNCDGVNVPCVYNMADGNPHHGIFDVTNGATSGSDSSLWTGPMVWQPTTQNGPLVGEMGYNLVWLFGSSFTGYDISFDSAPSFYIDGQPQAVDSTGHIVLNPLLRSFEQRAATVKAFDPYIDSTKLTPVANYLVDAPTLKALHMINADPQRTMSFTMFSKPDYYFQTYSPCPVGQGCVNSSFAWIHGDYAPDIGKTWLGIVGPGVRNNSLDTDTWTDHTDIVPTVMKLVGLGTDYVPDGRVITQVLKPSVGASGIGESFSLLGAVYKQINAPYGAFANSLIIASTNGIKSDDNTYLSIEQQIQTLATRRDALVMKIKEVLNGGSNGHQAQLILEAVKLLADAAKLAGL